MVIHPDDRTVARAIFHVAVGMVAKREDDEAARELAQAALNDPSPTTIRALVAAGRDKPWLASVVEAMAQVGVAAAEDVLGDLS